MLSRNANGVLLYGMNARRVTECHPLKSTWSTFLLNCSVLLRIYCASAIWRGGKWIDNSMVMPPIRPRKFFIGFSVGLFSMSKHTIAFPTLQLSSTRWISMRIVSQYHLLIAVCTTAMWKFRNYAQIVLNFWYSLLKSFGLWNENAF